MFQGHGVVEAALLFLVFFDSIFLANGTETGAISDF
jgi:hypothetical protein